MKNYFAPELETLKFTAFEDVCDTISQKDKPGDGTGKDDEAGIASV